MIYHVKKDSNDDFSRIKIQSIMFLNRCFNEIEKNYWFTKLKIVDIVWMIRKIRHMIESNECSSTIIYTDHSIVVSILRQTNLITFNTDKLNLRLIRASQYLFDFNLQMKHKIDKFNIVSNAFFRFQTNVITTKKIDVLKTLYESSIDLCDDDLITKESAFLTCHIILIEMTDDFKNKLKKIYANEFHWIKILIMIKSNNNDSSLASKTIVALKTTIVVVSKTTIIVSSISSTSEVINFRSDLRFKYRNDLIYFTAENDRERFCISASLKQKIFQLIHDQTHHENFHRTYDRIAFFVYIHQLFKRLRTYIAHCSNCQLNQIKRHFIYDELTSIITSSISFHIVSMNWVMIMSMIKNDFNVLLTIICKFTKRVLFIRDKNIWNTKKWTKTIFIDFVNHDWNIFCVMINDKNFKFMSNFWKNIIKKLNIIMLTFIVWHSQTNEQFERTNQIIEIVIRFHTTAHSNENWFEILSFLQTKNNNVKHNVIDFAFNELTYEFKINDTFEMLFDLSSKNFNRLRQIKRKKVESIMIFVNVISKTRYDLHYKIISDVFKFDFMIYFRFHQNYTISNLINKKFSNQKIDFFKILKSIDKSKQTYRLKLSSIMKIYSVIFIAQLKSITSKSNSYNKHVKNNSSFVEKKNSHSETPLYEIKRLFDKRISRNLSQYLMKWKKYDNEHNVWYFFRELNNADELIIEYEARQKQLSTRSKRKRERVQFDVAVDIQFDVVVDIQLDVAVDIQSESKINRERERERERKRSRDRKRSDKAR